MKRFPTSNQKTTMIEEVDKIDYKIIEIEPLSSSENDINGGESSSLPGGLNEFESVCSYHSGEKEDIEI